MKLPIVLLALIAAAALSGCIRRKVVITSEPSGAMVYWNEQYRGRTPIDIPFKWYWKYKVNVEREGYQPLEAVEHFRTPPWLIEPLEFFAELIPFKVTDTRTLHYTLEPQTEPAEDQPQRPPHTLTVPDLSGLMGN